MMNNVIIDKPERIGRDLEDFKIDAVEDEKNFTAAKITLCRDPETESPIVFYSQELNRNFKNDVDPLGKRFLIKTFTPNNAMTAADVTLERKFGDAMLAHKRSIEDYSPLSDIHSQVNALRP